MTVIQNTYPKHNGVPHAEIGDVVQWQRQRGKMNLVRLSDGKSVFSRDCVARGVVDDRPVIGTIAEVKSKGWRITLAL